MSTRENLRSITSLPTGLRLVHLLWFHRNRAALMALIQTRFKALRRPFSSHWFEENVSPAVGFVFTRSQYLNALTGTNSRPRKRRCERIRLRPTVMLNHCQRMRCFTHFSPQSRSAGVLVQTHCGVTMVTSLLNKNLPTKKLSLLCCCLCKYDFIYCLFNILSICFVAMFSCLSH